MKVLVVDDDRDILDSTAYALYLHKYTVVKAKDGREGLNAFKVRGPFDFVLTDFSMPIMNGIDMTLAIRKLNPKQSIVILTGSFGLENTLANYGLADVPVLTKPYSIKDVMETIGWQAHC